MFTESEQIDSGLKRATHILFREEAKSIMNKVIVVFSGDKKLVDQMREQLHGLIHLISCDSLELLAEQLNDNQVGSVLVHVGPELPDGLSAGRFVAALDTMISDSSVLALFEPDCPQRLRGLMEKRADSCLNLPLDMDALNAVLDDASNPEEDLAGFWRGLPHKELHGRSRSLVTFTPEMFEMMEEVTVAAKHDVTVLLVGETGTGKTHLARLIHELSNRREERLCTVSCGALPPDLIESELFGYVKGAFTGADRNKEGKFAAAGCGTLLLDEIDVLTMGQQAKLLRVIETGEYEPVGSNDMQISLARLVVASNYNLEDLVQSGTFRTDLYYRLNILKFQLLPLRQRPWDIEYLARKFALEHSRTHNIPLRDIDPLFLDALMQHQWPGNIREMENVIRRAVLYCHRGVLTVKDLPESVRTAAENIAWMPPQSVLAAGKEPVAHHVRSGVREVATQPSGDHYPAVGTGGLPPQGHGVMDGDNAAPGHGKTLEDRVGMVEQRIIEECLRRNNHRRKETAKELGISRVTLYNKMKKFGLMG